MTLLLLVEGRCYDEAEMQRLEAQRKYFISLYGFL